MHRINQINLQFADAKPKKASRKAFPHDDVIVNLGLDKTMSAKGNEIRKNLRAFMSENNPKLNDYIERAEFPHFMIDGLR
jgi:hypothetical protein